MRALVRILQKKLVTPRVVATVFMGVFLTIIADLFGWLAAVNGGHPHAWLGFRIQYWTSFVAGAAVCRRYHRMINRCFTDL